MTRHVSLHSLLMYELYYTGNAQILLDPASLSALSFDILAAAAGAKELKALSCALIFFCI